MPALSFTPNKRKRKGKNMTGIIENKQKKEISFDPNDRKGMISLSNRAGILGYL